MLIDSTTAVHDTAKLVVGGAVAQVALPPAPSADFMQQVIHYSLPLIYTLFSHLILNLFKPKTNGTQSNN
ncbi:MAG TPA: hypothetical protein VHA56_03180 [Mucilaginibacter sp.]|nr:hypothetical protein [Mucilaginibacter sp.]